MPSYALTASEQAHVDGVREAYAQHTLTGIKEVRIDEQLENNLAGVSRNIGCVAAKIVYLRIANIGADPISALTVDAGTIDLPLGIGESIVLVGNATCAAICAAWSDAVTFDNLKVTTGAGPAKAYLSVLALSIA